MNATSAVTVGSVTHVSTPPRCRGGVTGVRRSGGGGLSAEEATQLPQSAEPGGSHAEPAAPVAIVTGGGQISPVTTGAPASPTPRLSKSRFVAGWQCHKLLWWTVNEKDAPELQPDTVLRDLFDQGVEVGERARREWPGGVLIEGDRYDRGRLARTRDALASSTPAVFEACFEEAGVFCAVDVLERHRDGWTLIEVKSSSEVKDYHYPDLAVQVHVARRAGLVVNRIEVMHLNKDFRHPDQGVLFQRSDVTEAVEALMPEVPHRIAEQVEVMGGPLPERPVGAHCWFRGGDCAFLARCWPQDADHIRNLWNVGPKRTMEWMQKGVHRMTEIPATQKLNDKQKRQLRAQREQRLIVERGLADALAPALAADRLGFLDFETVARAIPAWDGLGPWRAAAAQFSYHEARGDGRYGHAQFLAEGPLDPSDPPDDPREPLARAMLDATRASDRVVVYSNFEATRIRELAERLPHLQGELLALRDRLWDLKPVIENHVYHPAFHGSFSLKDILHPLVPDLSYDDLIIVDGRVASVEIARLLFVSGRIPPAQRDQTRHDLLEYCKRDTFATVRLVERLAELALEPTG